jgi:hypothetical protein
MYKPFSSNYDSWMGIFSKPKPKVTEVIPESQLLEVINKFSGWLPSKFSKEINGKKYNSTNLGTLVDLLVRASAQSGDELLLQFTAKSCASFQDTEEDSIESLAQLHFDLTTSSMGLRKTYAKDSAVLEGITVIGLASYSVFEKHPKYKKVLEYMSSNAQKLAGTKSSPFPGRSVTYRA